MTSRQPIRATTETVPTQSRGRPWLYPYNRRLRHLHGISIRNVSLSSPQSRPRGNTVDDAALPTSLKSPAKALALQERKQVEHSRSITDLKAIAEAENGSDDKGKGKAEEMVEASPGKRPAMRRLRRRSTIDWQNSSSHYRQQKLESVISTTMADVFFSLHVASREDPIYISEAIHKTMNPDFRFFDLNEGGPTMSRLEDLTIKIWARTEQMGEYQYLLEMQLNMRSLQFIGKTIEGFPHPLPQNCILFHMKDGIYTTFLDNFTGEPSIPAAAPQRAMSASQVLFTSSYDSLMRLSTLDECVQDALSTRMKLEHEINQILEANAGAIHTVRDVSFRRSALSDMNDAVALERRRLAAAKRRRDELSTRLAQRKEYMRKGYSSIEEGQPGTSATLVAEIDAMKENTSVNIEATLGQRRRICEDLEAIYPIEPLPNRSLHFSIRDIPLPNATALLDSDDLVSTENVDAALGHVALIVDRLQYYLSVPLPYPITARGSTSTILDPISEVAGGIGGRGSRVYPLFTGGKGGGSARSRFEFGVFLLNKNVEVLSERLGLRVMDLRMTLGNLKYLLYVATAGNGEIPARKAGGIRGFLRGGGSDSALSSRRGSVDSQESAGGGEAKGLMLPPPVPAKALLGALGSANGTANNGRLKLGYGPQAAATRASKLREPI